MTPDQNEIAAAGSSSAPPDLALSALVVPLLKGVLYRDADAAAWHALLNLQPTVRDYVAVLGLELVLDEAEGYAFLRSQPDSDDDSTGRPPRLIARRQLSFPVSLTLALLRKKLAEFDATGGDTRLVLTLDEIAELLRVFLPAGTNEVKLIDQIELHVNKIVELGFLRRLKTDPGARAGNRTGFEVRRILKAFIDAQWLSEFDSRLAAYQIQLSGQAGAPNGGLSDA
ncbi:MULTISPECIES: DUF4194 domain-containing protein [unclassified Cupriavidus]|nr:MULTISPECIES: DUF4194 domain-containing protein [unclassified Cupriavidus]MBP0632065.1 DUF4194 domain-containing protein [Cupriavidus sp. AcVe19-1a]MBP0637279.1 DUF4194 domain-containing protein [Cupriavidus sp. AcVe19-6a]